MTETQKKLIPYVESRVCEIIEYKERNDMCPLIAMEPEIIKGIHTDVIECMRELHRQGSYRATHTLNSPALIKQHKND